MKVFICVLVGTLISMSAHAMGPGAPTAQDMQNQADYAKAKAAAAAKEADDQQRAADAKKSADAAKAKKAAADNLAEAIKNAKANGLSVPGDQPAAKPQAAAPKPAAKPAAAPAKQIEKAEEAPDPDPASAPPAAPPKPVAAAPKPAAKPTPAPASVQKDDSSDDEDENCDKREPGVQGVMPNKNKEKQSVFRFQPHALDKNGKRLGSTSYCYPSFCFVKDGDPVPTYTTCKQNEIPDLDDYDVSKFVASDDSDTVTPDKSTSAGAGVKDGERNAAHNRGKSPKFVHGVDPKHLDPNTINDTITHGPSQVPSNGRNQ